MVLTETLDVGRKYGINIFGKLTQKDIMNIKEMQARQDKRNLGACSVRLDTGNIKADWQ